MLAPQPQAFEQEVAEIDGVEGLQALLVGGVELAPLPLAKAPASPAGTCRASRPRFFQPSMMGGELARRPALLVDALRLDHLLHQAELVVGVEDGEVGPQAHELGVAAQDLGADRVEGAEPRHALGDGPMSAAMRSRISRAALLVKVTARIWDGPALPVAIRWAMRVVSTRVLPVPAPASTSTGPSVASTAARCSGLRPVR